MSFVCSSPLMGSPRSRGRHASLGNIKPRSPFLESRRTSAALLQTPASKDQTLLLSPSILSREWSRSRSDRTEDTGSNYSPSPSLSSIAPSPGSRIRNMMHARAQANSAPRLTGSSFALVGSIFDAISTTIQNPEGKPFPKIEVANPNPLVREESLDGNDFFAIQLPNLIFILQSMATKHLVSDQLPLKDKMFLTQLLCETYKLKHDVFYGSLVACVTAANATVARMPQQDTDDVWSCDNVLGIILALANAEAAVTSPSS